jgi:DNA-binding NtrC family response regulator
MHGVPAPHAYAEAGRYRPPSTQAPSGTPDLQPQAGFSPNLAGNVVERTTIPSPPAVGPGHFERLNHAYREQELEALRAALRQHGGNVSDVAKVLGVSRQKVYRLIEADPTLDLDDFRKRS